MYINIESVEPVIGDYAGQWIKVNNEYYTHYSESTLKKLKACAVVKCAPKVSSNGYKHLNPIKGYREVK